MRRGAGLGGGRARGAAAARLLRRLRKRGSQVVKLRSARTTCDARRFDAAGFYAYLWTCFRLLLRYRLGGDVCELAAAYARGNPAP